MKSCEVGRAKPEWSHQGYTPLASALAPHHDLLSLQASGSPHLGMRKGGLGQGWQIWWAIGRFVILLLSSNRKFQKLSVSSQNSDSFTHRALIRWHKKGISGKRRLLMKTGATSGGLSQGPGFQGAP